MNFKIIGLFTSYLITFLLPSAYSFSETESEPNTNTPLSNFTVTYGGRGFEAAQDIINVSTGGFLVAGRTASSTGGTDMYLLKLNGQGQLEWEQKIGEDESDEAAEIIEAENGTFIIVGNSDSYGGGPGLKDMWAVKVDAQGNEVWNKTYGTDTSIDEARGIAPAHDGGYVIIGHTLSLEQESSDVMLIKIDSNGEKIWEKTFGGDKSEEGADVVQVEDGYTVLGHTESLGKGKWDIWLFHVDKEGNQMWEKTFGGGDNEMGNALTTLSDGSYVIAGYTYSFAVASLDAWVIKTDQFGEQIWAKVFGGLSTDEAFDVIETKDGNILAAGYTQVYTADQDGNNTSTEGYNVFLVKIDGSGKEIWQSSLGDNSEQRAFGVVETPDEGIVTVGLTNSEENNGYDVLVMKVSKSGL